MPRRLQYAWHCQIGGPSQNGILQIGHSAPASHLNCSIETDGGCRRRRRAGPELSGSLASQGILVLLPNDRARRSIPCVVPLLTSGQHLLWSADSVRGLGLECRAGHDRDCGILVDVSPPNPPTRTQQQNLKCRGLGRPLWYDNSA